MLTMSGKSEADFSLLSPLNSSSISFSFWAVGLIFIQMVSTISVASFSICKYLVGDTGDDKPFINILLSFPSYFSSNIIGCEDLS